MPPWPSLPMIRNGPIWRGGELGSAAATTLVQPGEAPLQTGLRDLERRRHPLEVAAAARRAAVDLLAGEVGGLAEARAAVDAVVERGAGDAELGRRRLEAPAVGAQRRQDLVVADVLEAAIRRAPGPGAAAAGVRGRRHERGGRGGPLGQGLRSTRGGGTEPDRAVWGE